MSKNNQEDKIDEMEEFLENTFPEGEYYKLTILVKKDSFRNFMDKLSDGSISAAIMPNVEDKSKEIEEDEDEDSKKGKLQ